MAAVVAIVSRLGLELKPVLETNLKAIYNCMEEILVV